jgi:hypothetical protein
MTVITLRKRCTSANENTSKDQTRLRENIKQRQLRRRRGLSIALHRVSLME